MTDLPLADSNSFKRILARNILLPLGVGMFSVVVFVGLIFYLLSVLKLVEHTEEVLANANEAVTLSVNMESAMRGYLITGDDDYLASYDISKPAISTRMSNLTALVRDNPLQGDRLQRLHALQLEWSIFAQKKIDLRHAQLSDRESFHSGRGNALFKEIRSEFADVIDTEKRLLRERNDTVKQTTMWTVGLYLLFTLSVSALLALLGRRELLNLSTTFDDVLKKHTDRAAILKAQSWMITGQGELNEHLVGHPTLAGVGLRALEYLVRHLEVTVAAFYVREDDGTLRHVESYGTERQIDGQAFHDKEGLLGRAVHENRLLLVQDVPDDYLNVISGLGQGKPKNVVVLPFMTEGRVNGVLELGFMRMVESRDLDFLKLVSSNIGNAVGLALYRQRVQDILDEAQQLNEELQERQEQLGAVNEELEAQSQVLEQSQTGLRNQKTQLELSNAQLTEQALQLDQKNAALNLAQVALDERSNDLQRASRYKSEFLANMSHELRTPLNSSLILAKLLADNPQGNLQEEQVKFAETIYSAGNDLLNLINDILDISKVEAGKLELMPETISIARMVAGLKRTFDPLAQQKHLDFSTVIDSSAPAAIVSDIQRVEQILRNLLSNAIKFTEAGGVSLRVGRAADGGISFAVSDSGIGVAPEQHAAIFEAFRQADGTTSRRYGGTGLGLSISRDLTTLLGGALRLASAPAQGSTFTLVLPEHWQDNAAEIEAQRVPERHMALPAAPAVPAILPLPQELPRFADDRHSSMPHTRTVLVIEDEPAFAGILFDLAHEMQFRCLVAHGADEGLALAAQYLPDAILLDMRLPDGSGLGVLQQLKEIPATRHIPVHVVSAADRSDTAMQLGAIGYAQKPTTREELKEVFRKLEVKFKQSVKRVLLVEDDARQRAAVAQLIGAPDVEITAVELGDQALQHLRTTVFDCMIIDLKLPDIEGNELLKRMAAEEITSFPPVIVYTGRNLTRAEEMELRKYSNSIIIKGARSPERLVDEVTLFLHKVETQLSSEAQSMLQVVRNRDRIFEGRKVLLVDDDVRNIFALTSALERKGLTVEIGRNGFEAISQLEAIADIDLVLMDVMMPGMDGLEATRRIRGIARFRKLPIIAITAKAMKDDQEQCINAGATDYLAKPIDLERLYSLLRIWMPHLERYAE